MSTTTMSGRVPATQSATGGDYFRQFVVIVATLATISINLLANILPFNGQNTGEISDRFKVYFVPAGYVFAIWGIIYIGILAYTIYQALPAQRTNPRMRSTGWLYVLSCIANSTWIFLWHYEQFMLSVLVIFVLLASLALIYMRLAPTRLAVSRGEWWTTNLTFSIYLAWASVATIANITAYLYYIGWNGGGIAPELWAVIMLVVATALGFIFGLRWRDVGFLAVLIWAFIGIAVKQSGAPLVAWTAAGTAALLTVLAVYCLFNRGNVQADVASTAKAAN
jgi:translocator protein